MSVEVDSPVAQNEICYIYRGGVKLMAEVIKVISKNAYVQVFESTRGLRSTIPWNLKAICSKQPWVRTTVEKLRWSSARPFKNGRHFLKAGDYTDALDYDVDWEFHHSSKWAMR